MAKRLITPPVPARLSYDHHMAVAHAILANVPSEAVMRIGLVIIIIWLIIGAVAAGQRHYYNSSDTNCATTGTVIVTIIAGPLNYVGVNPKVSCKTPQPSK
jgi:membrane protein YdbS with pleckstrin-like domain